MSDPCSKRLKRIFAVGGVLTFIAFILLIVAATAGADKTVDFVTSNRADFDLYMDKPEHCGFILYLKNTDNCQDVLSTTSVIGPDSKAVYLGSGCNDAQEDWAKDKHPEVRKLGYFGFGANLVGTYFVSSSQPLWSVHACGEMKDADKNITTATGPFVSAMIFCFLAFVACCTGCYCIGNEKGPVDGDQEALQATGIGKQAMEKMALEDG